MPDESQLALWCLWLFCGVCFVFLKDERRHNAFVIAFACSISILLSWYLDLRLPLGLSATESNAWSFVYHLISFILAIAAGAVVMLLTENVKAVLAIALASLLHVYSLFTLFMGVIPSHEGVYTGLIIASNLLIGLTMLSHGSFNVQSIYKSFLSSVRPFFSPGPVDYVGKKSAQKGVQ